MQQWLKANGGPLAIALVGLGLIGWTSKLFGLLALAVGLTWFVVDQVHARRARPTAEQIAEELAGELGLWREVLTKLPGKMSTESPEQVEARKQQVGLEKLYEKHQRDERMTTLAGLIREGELLYDRRVVSGNEGQYARWISDHSAWHDRLGSELTKADNIRTYDHSGFIEPQAVHEKDLGPAKARLNH